jgi:hypothetical protein
MTAVYTTQTQKRGFLMAVLIALASTILVPPVSAQQIIFEKVWSNHNTGFALDGYDVVAYFTNMEATKGKPEYEVKWRNYYFHFQNQGNLLAFLDSPEVYLPAFGGFSPVPLANGILAEGNPNIWLLDNGRLLIFQNNTEKVKWQKHSLQLQDAANKNWLSIRQI